jgi:hypothetical protein
MTSYALVEVAATAARSTGYEVAWGIEGLVSSAAAKGSNVTKYAVIASVTLSVVALTVVA